MAEKQYYEIRESNGTIHISHAVIAEMAALACLETEGVAAMAAAGDKGTRGIVFTPGEEDTCTIDAHILVKMGATVSQCAEKAQAAVKNAVELGSGLSVSQVNIFVAGISLK